MEWKFSNPLFITDNYDESIRYNSAWLGHRSFAYDLVQYIRPSVVVELGTHYGASFFTFCQAASDLSLDCKCFAVDTWAGDANTGSYEETVYEVVNRTCSKFFPNHGFLVRSTFDEAVGHFLDESVDILHIDGCHSLEAVTRDFHLWLPKVKPGGMVLFHDISVVLPGFGVNQLWSVLRAAYPHLEFQHSAGLGVLFPKGLTDEGESIIRIREEIEHAYAQQALSEQRSETPKKADPLKIHFIICVSDEESFAIASRHIASLNIPPGYTVQAIKVTNVPSMAAGYNAAMMSSDAKYKIYMHQDVYIINPDFLLDLLESFSADSDLGLIGLCGAEHLPPNGVWWQADSTIGKVIENRGVYRYLEFAAVDGPIREAEAVDGFLMATQYDVRWREDLFDGWHFYDTSQSLEFKKSGYKVGIPRQASPWCIHYWGHEHVFDETGYTKYQTIFLQHYRQLADA